MLVPIFNKTYLKKSIPFFNKLFCLNWFNPIVDKLRSKYPGDSRALIFKYTEVTDFNVIFDQEQLLNIPKYGPCIIISNHPTDLLDHIVVATALSEVRRDYKFIANNKVEKFNLWNDLIFPLNLYDKNKATLQNIRALRGAVNWLKEGHVVITYPGARPSSLSKKIRSGRRIWSSLPILLAKKTGAPIIPMKIILKEPIYHRVIKFMSRYLYSFLVLRVMKFFSNKSSKLEIGNPYKPHKEKISKREVGIKLFKLVNNL